MKRLSNIWNDVVSVDLTVQDIIDGTKYKRGKREVKKLLYDKDVVAEHPKLWHQIDKAKAKEYAKYLIAMLEDGTWIHQRPKHRQQACQENAQERLLHASRMPINQFPNRMGKALQQ